MAKEATAVKTEEKGLENFVWDTPSSNFFGIPDTGVEEKKEVEEVIEEVKKEETPKSKEVPKEETEENEEVEDEFFETKTEEEDSKEDNEEEEDDSTKEEGNLTDLAKDLVDRGVLSNVELELEEGEEVTEDKFFELQEQEVQSRVDETFEAFFEELDDDGAAFLKFKKEGGATKEFFKIYSQSSAIPSNLDLTKVEDQDKALKFYYAEVEGIEAEDIPGKLEWLEEIGKKEAYAKKYWTKVEKADTKRKEESLASQEATKKAQEEGRKTYETELKSTIDETDKIGDFTFSKKDKKELYAYMTKPSVKVGKNNFLTGMQADMQKLFEDKQKLALFAKLLKSDFDVSEVKKQTKTKVAQKAKARISKQRPKNTSSQMGDKSLADYFN